MKRPWMPLYIADYLRKTTHLGALESGAYLHLIMDYWQNDKLPDDERQLARIAKLTDREWKACRSTLQAFFHDGWKHERIDAEIAEAGRLAESNAGKARDAANKRWAKHNSGKHEVEREQSSEHAPSNAPLCTLHTTQSKKDAAGAAPVDPEVELFQRGRAVLGKQAGGMVSKLLAVKGKNVALARAAIEQASTKSDPREYVGRIINGQKPGETAWLGGVEGII
jgi:uncharacterized protein YdaU (DUF1376 family)